MRLCLCQLPATGRANRSEFREREREKEKEVFIMLCDVTPQNKFNLQFFSSNQNVRVPIKVRILLAASL